MVLNYVTLSLAATWVVLNFYFILFYLFEYLKNQSVAGNVIQLKIYKS